MMRTRNRIKRLVRIIGLLVFLSLTINISNNAFAGDTIVTDKFFDKTVMQGVYNCYSKYDAIKGKIGDLGDFQEDYLRNDNNHEKTYFLEGLLNGNANKTGNVVRFITGVKADRVDTSDLQGWFGDGNAKIRCKKFFLGSYHLLKGYDGLFDLMGKENDIPSGKQTKMDKITDFMSKMGYTISKKSSGNADRCFSLKFQRYVKEALGKTINKYLDTEETNNVCLKDGKLEADNDYSTKVGGTVQGYSRNVFLSIDSGSSICVNTVDTTASFNSRGSPQKVSTNCSTLKYKDKFDSEFLLTSVKNACNKSLKCDSPTHLTYDHAKFLAEGSVSELDKDNEEQSASSYEAKLENRSTSAMTAVRYLSNDGFLTLDSLRIKRLEMRLLYQRYLTGFYNLEVDCSNGSEKLDLSDGKINWMDNDWTMKECNYYLGGRDTGNDNKPVSAVNEKTGFLSKEINGFEALLKVVKSLPKDYTEEEIEEAKGMFTGSEVDNKYDENGEEEGEEVSTCASAGGAGSLGWIVCPVLEWLGDMAEGVYNEYVEPALQVSPLLFTGGNDAALNSWGTFRDIANVIFVIVLLVVIFSQLTGVGIDNYGIKKILPKLIVMAVLVNLSYALCILAVDVSNILGNGFQSMFNGMSQQLSQQMSSSIPEGGYIIKTDAGDSLPINANAITGLTGVGILGMIVAGGVAIWASPAILLSLLVAAIGIAVSIFFLFILLSARQAAILVMVIMSPLAVVMYVLPNTKKLFDRWLKMFEGLLFVYPICGLLVGAGGYVSRLLIYSGAGTGNFIWSFMAMVVSIVPIFFIPTVLKGAFSAMGKMGGTLAGLGAMASRGATGRIRNSEMYRNAEQSSLERQARIRGGFDRDGNTSARRRALGTVLSGGRRNRQRNALRYQSMLRDRGSLEATEGENFMLETQSANLLKNLEASGATNTIGSMGENGRAPSGLTGGLYNALRNGDRAGIVAYTDALSAKGEHGRNGVKEAYNAAVESGAVSQQAANTFANNIMNNHAADYKNNARSVFEVANQINRGGQAQTTGQQMQMENTNDNGLPLTGQAYLANRATAGTMGNMDDNEFRSVFGDGTIPSNLAGIGATAEQENQARRAIGATAYAALNDQNANIKADRRQQLQNIVDQSGYVAPTQTVRIDHTPHP